jgi:hypothetical protein
MELTYRMESDYQIPNLALPEEPGVTLGKYALLRKKYLKQHRRVLYLNLLTAGTLGEHLSEIEHTASEMMEQITRQMAAAQGVDERLKAENQLLWVGKLNNIRACADEIIRDELIFN